MAIVELINTHTTRVLLDTSTHIVKFTHKEGNPDSGPLVTIEMKAHEILTVVGVLITNLISRWSSEEAAAKGIPNDECRYCGFSEATHEEGRRVTSCSTYTPSFPKQ